MDVVGSAELRWFSRGDAPSGLLSWFGAPDSASPEIRTDVYVLLPGCEAVGIKLREGKFEIKALCPGTRDEDLTVGLIGHIERWVKWSFVPPSAAEFHHTVEAGARTARIRKARRLSKYSIRNCHPEKIATSSHLKSGCNFEITELIVQDSSWWSLGFEAFGPEQHIEGNLLTVAKHVLSNVDVPDLLRSAVQISYPAWIASLVRTGEIRVGENGQ